MGFRAPAPCATGPIHDPHTRTDIDLEQPRIYEGEEVEAFCARITAGPLESPRDDHAGQDGARP